MTITRAFVLTIWLLAWVNFNLGVMLTGLVFLAYLSTLQADYFITQRA
jgi:hypothetical protein